MRFVVWENRMASGTVEHVWNVYSWAAKVRGYIRKSSREGEQNAIPTSDSKGIRQRKSESIMSWFRNLTPSPNFTSGSQHSLGQPRCFDRQLAMRCDSNAMAREARWFVGFDLERRRHCRLVRCAKRSLVHHWKSETSATHLRCGHTRTLNVVKNRCQSPLTLRVPHFVSLSQHNVSVKFNDRATVCRVCVRQCMVVLYRNFGKNATEQQ